MVTLFYFPFQKLRGRKGRAGVLLFWWRHVDAFRLEKLDRAMSLSLSASQPDASIAALLLLCCISLNFSVLAGPGLASLMLRRLAPCSSSSSSWSCAALSAAAAATVAIALE